MILTEENRSTRRETCPGVTSSTTNPTWTDPAKKSGHGGERPSTNSLSYGRATYVLLSNCQHGLLHNLCIFK
jgi:hypothetical protein